MKRHVLSCALLLAACRDSGGLYCGAVSATVQADASACVIDWADCSDDVDRSMDCTFVGARYECTCYENGETSGTINFSDDICETLDVESRNAIRASSNATCGWHLESAE